MSNLANTLRMYAEDMHSATGYNERSSSMSKAADMIEKFENMSACEACATIPSVMEYVQQLEQERDASRDMLDSTRLELELLREAMGVPVEPHQSLSDRMLEAAKELKGKLDSTEQRLQRRMKDIQEQAKRYVTLESNCQAIAAQNEALRDALEELMRWQVQNVKVWSNSAYDNAHRTITSLPNLAAEVLKRRDAATLRRAAKRFECAVYTGHVSTVLSLWAADIEKETT